MQAKRQKQMPREQKQKKAPGFSEKQHGSKAQIDFKKKKKKMTCKNVFCQRREAEQCTFCEEKWHRINFDDIAQFVGHKNQMTSNRHPEPSVLL